MQRGRLEDRQAQVERPSEYSLGGFDDDGRQVVKKTYKSGKAADKPEFFMGGCDPTVPTGPKRKLRTSWLANAPPKEETPPPIPTPTRKWTPVHVKKLPPKSASHDGTVPLKSAGQSDGIRKGRKPFKPATSPGEKAEEATEVVKADDTKATETKQVDTKVAELATVEQPTAHGDEAAQPKEKEKEEEEAPKAVVKSPASHAKPLQLPKQEGRGLSPARGVSPVRVTSPVNLPKQQARGKSPVRMASPPKITSPVKPASPEKKTWQPPVLHIRKPVQPTDDDRDQQATKEDKPAEAVVNGNGHCGACEHKDELIKQQADEIKKLKEEKGELLAEVKKIKGSQRMNKELKDEIFELKQQLSKKEQADANSKGFHKLENKLNTLKMVMDGKVNKQNLEDLQEHVALLNMILNQDLKKEGMKNVWI